MDLLPKTHTQFSEKSYWEKFFKKWGNKAFEWYGEYGVLCGLLHKYMKPAERVLMIGCGNSSLSADMYDVGYRALVNIDISDTAIAQMTEKNRERRPDMPFIKMDMLKMEFSDGEFSAVLDKGTLDAIMTDAEPATLEKIDTMFSEIGRVLKTGGRYVAVSLAQDHILNYALRYFADNGWMVRVCRVNDNDDSEIRSDFHMPVFVFVFTKMKMKMPKPILELCLFESQASQRFDDVEALVAAVKELQQYALVRQQLGKNKQDDGDQVSVELFSAADSKHPRYVLTVVDTPGKTRAPFAIFIVPEGREVHWLFSTPLGRKELARSAGFGRVVVVRLSREHKYPGGLEEVKAELSAKVMQLAPQGVTDDKKVPFLSEGEDLGQREVVYRGHSELSGDFVVEDVQQDGEMFRRLVFLASSSIVQSEAKLTTVRKKKGKKGGGGAGGGGGGAGGLVVDAGHICSNYGKLVLGGLTFLEDKLDTGLDMLMLGLGGGGLASYIHKQFPKVHSEVVELDPAVVDVARKWFHLPEDDHLKVTVADALDVVFEHSSKGQQHDLVILDVAGSEEKAEELTCPPAVFIQPAFLAQVKQILKPTGLFILNVVCREEKYKEDVVFANLRAHFPQLYRKEVQDYVNEIVFAFPTKRDVTEAKRRKPGGKLGALVNEIKGLQIV